jgi:hypothetical protein
MSVEETPTVSVDDFNIKKVMPEAIKQFENLRQYCILPKYQYKESYEKLSIITEPITILNEGIPAIHAEWRPTDNDRMYFWLSDLHPAGKKLFNNVFCKLDDEFDTKINTEKNKDYIQYKSNENKKITLKSLKYKNAVKIKIPESKNEEDGADLKESYKRIKIAFNTMKQTSDEIKAKVPKIITTEVYTLNAEQALKQEKITCVDDISNVLCYKSTAVFVLEITKIWAMLALNGERNRDCSYSVKCVKILVLDSPKKNVQRVMSANVFSAYTAPVKQINNVVEVETKKEDIKLNNLNKEEIKKEEEEEEEEEDEEDEEDEEEEEEDEPVKVVEPVKVPEPVKVVQKVVAKKQNKKQ